MFAAFYAEHYSILLTAARARLGVSEDAEDAVAETFRIAWAHYGSSGEVELAWVYRTLRNVVGNEYQRAQALAIREARVAARSKVTGSSDLDAGMVVRGELLALSEADRELLFMRYWEDLGAPEIARILGCSAGAVRVRLHRARERLEQRLAPSEVSELGGERHGGRDG